MEYGLKLNPTRSLWTPRGIKGFRQKVIITHNPSTVDQNQLLLVRFPNLGQDDVIVPGTVYLSFDIELNSRVDTKRTLVNNIGRALIKRLAVKFEGNEIICIEDYDVFACFKDNWRPVNERKNAIRQGIITDSGCTENCMKIRISASDKNTAEQRENVIAECYKNKFVIPLDFEILSNALPYYQAGLGNRLCYELTFNDYARVIRSAPAKPTTGSTPTPDASYIISNISLEYDMITQAMLAKEIRTEYQTLPLLYDRVLRRRKIRVNKSDTVWNWNFNTPARSLKGILVLFENESDYNRDTSRFYNPNLQKVSTIIEGKPNQLFSQGMQPHEQYDEIRKYFAGHDLKDVNASEVEKILHLSAVNTGDYLTKSYGLWLDFRTIDENNLHGTGRRIENASEGITLQIEKKAEEPGFLNCYIYLIMDAQLNIQNGEFVSTLY